MSIRLTPTTGRVTAKVTNPTPVTTPLPIANYGTCEDCSEDLVPLTNNSGEVRTVFCEYCEFGF
ncbi:hypothetical protein [Streptomyces sp. NPDC001076]